MSAEDFIYYRPLEKKPAPKSYQEYIERENQLVAYRAQAAANMRSQNEVRWYERDSARLATTKKAVDPMLSIKGMEAERRRGLQEQRARQAEETKRLLAERGLCYTRE